jgi:tetraacyldisaccharide 4'-kinase
LTGAIPAAGGAPLPFAGFGRERVTAFAGIADPASFFDALEGEGVLLVATLAFPDHTPYGEEEIAAICRLRDASRSASLITTGKDAVKLAPYLEKLGVVYIAALEMEIRNRNSLEKELEKLLLKRG